MTIRMAGAAFVLALCATTPAMAQGSAVPEPSTLALFGLGALGVIVGRRSGRSRRD